MTTEHPPKISNTDKHYRTLLSTDDRTGQYTIRCKCGWSTVARGMLEAHDKLGHHVTEATLAIPEATPEPAKPNLRTRYPVGAHVVYRGNSYSFPGEVTMRDDTGVVVKAFGDMDGNYTGMKHIYADKVLEPYVLGGGDGEIPPLVIFPDDNPIAKMRAWVKLHGPKPGKQRLGVYTIRKLLEELEELGEKQAAWEEREAVALRNAKALAESEMEAVRYAAGNNGMGETRLEPVRDKRECYECAGTGWIGGQGGDTCGACGGKGVIFG